MTIEKFLLPLQPFVVNLGALKPGANHFDGRATKEFFESFGNQEIIDADVQVQFTVRSHGVSVDAECTIEGSVTVQCDRCLDDLKIAVSTGFEESYVAEGPELDLSQDIYDFICVSLPLQRVHPDGECNEETIKYLSK